MKQELHNRPEAEEIELMRQMVVRDLDLFTSRHGPSFSPPPSPPPPSRKRNPPLSSSSSSLFRPSPLRSSSQTPPHSSLPPSSPTPFSPPFVPSSSSSPSPSRPSHYASPPPNVTPTPHPLYTNALYNQADYNEGDYVAGGDHESDLDFSDDDDIYFGSNVPNRESESTWKRKPNLQAIPEDEEAGKKKK